MLAATKRMKKSTFANPFRPGAGHAPPYLAGRDEEMGEFAKLLKQEVVTDNLVITGLRGVGKTVLLDALKPTAFAAKWLWVGTDLSESASLTEENVSLRLLADLAAVTSSIEIGSEVIEGMGFGRKEVRRVGLTFDVMTKVFNATPGLISDKLKAVLSVAAEAIKKTDAKGLVFAYDEAQNLSDHKEEGKFPLSLLLDVFQSIQKQNIPFMLVLVGLPTLFPKLVEARTFAERMFHVIFLQRLDATASKEAILRPIANNAACPKLSDKLIRDIIDESGGYPYFIQFICREVYDVAVQKTDAGLPLTVSIPEITRKLDADFFAGRWSHATDRQRDLLRIVASLPDSDDEFTIQDVSNASKSTELPFSPSHVSQILSKLATAGLVYKNRHGRYAFAVPLLSRFIKRAPAS